MSKSVTENTEQQERTLITGPVQHLKLQFTMGPQGQRSVHLSHDSPLPKAGQLIAIDGLDHVLLVLSVKGGEIKIASFPRIPFGEIISDNGLENIKPYTGTLDGWLKENYNYYADPNDVKLEKKPFAFGTPSFQR
ncbi:MAG: hypothetical protein M3N23_11715 [Pseudomonadota bacterium]|nr:hypothetical protein [Pseudomonadota bacterium]